ncbi:MAG: hypothetical protein M1817_002026 [Caeruleum heppii]|nr:MAG: hypothetical protein M1817_002026 [Caeruleum heppii]
MLLIHLLLALLPTFALSSPLQARQVAPFSCDERVGLPRQGTNPPPWSWPADFNYSDYKTVMQLCGISSTHRNVGCVCHEGEFFASCHEELSWPPLHQIQLLRDFCQLSCFCPQPPAEYASYAAGKPPNTALPDPQMRVAMLFSRHDVENIRKKTTSEQMIKASSTDQGISRWYTPSTTTITSSTSKSSSPSSAAGGRPAVASARGKRDVGEGPRVTGLVGN